MIREFTDNLVQNAIRYNSAGGNVWVSVHGDEDTCLVVRDDGLGIPKKDQERVFERFYRVDKNYSNISNDISLSFPVASYWSSV